MLIGSAFSSGWGGSGNERNLDFLAAQLAAAGVEKECELRLTSQPQLRYPRIRAELLRAGNGEALLVILSEEEYSGALTVALPEAYGQATDLESGMGMDIERNRISVQIEQRECRVLKLRK